MRDELSKGQNNLEILFVDIGGRNGNTPCVPTEFNEIEKLKWLENFENLLADVYLKWKCVFIVTGDFNTDLLRKPEGRYKNLIHTFSLHQHITKATRKNKILIDHISSNMNHKLLHTDVLMTDDISF